MLKLSRFQRQATQPFVCCQYLARSNHTKSSNGLKPGSVRSQGPKVSKLFSASPTHTAPLEKVESKYLLRDEARPFETSPLQLSFRERLRKWEAENAASYVLPRANAADSIRPGDVVNNLTRPQGGEFQVAPDEVQTEDGSGRAPVFDRDELVDVGNNRTFLLPGDLVELMSMGSHQQEMAIFVRELEFQSQFYTMTGRYVHRASKSAKFFVPGFVKRDELSDILPFLPDTDIPQTMEDKLQSLPENVPRNVGRPLVQKMTSFWQQSEVVYQNAASRLDNAHMLIAHATKFKYATLDEVADQLLSPLIPKGADGKFSTPALYAVHRSIIRDDIGIRAQTQGTLRAGGQYEINSLMEVNNVNKVVDQVRKYRDDLLNSRRSSQLHGFISKARILIDHSRKTREFTSHGTLGPSSIKSSDGCPYRYGVVEESFTEWDESFLQFIESWACLSSFTAQSPLNGIGSTILRAIDRYAGVALDQSTAWTFLQEIGFMPPWENRAAFELRLPFTGRKLNYERIGSSMGFTPDKLSDLRRDWADLPVFCVDDATAHEIDDGVSIEATDVSNEYWVHIHTADPAAHIDPQSDVASMAEALTETVYMPERVVTMLNSDFVRANLSLAPKRPCLTFSAKMNLEGDILDTKIMPGTVKNVIFMTPSVLNDITVGPSEITQVTHVVGSVVPAPSASRPLVEAHQISQKHKADLRILFQIATARGEKLQARGGITSGPLTPIISVSFDGAEWQKPKANKCSRHYGDPTIQVVTQEQNKEMLTVSNNRVNTVGRLMLIANEVAAQWCHARGVPVPYRITPRNPDKENPADYYRHTLLPVMDSNGVAPVDITMAYLNLIGQVQPSTTPGPHVAIGVDMVAKCTSPLRRYGDLLLHWQVEAALLEESQSGKSLIGNTNEGFLPFTKAQIDALLPRLDTRERLIGRGKREADRAWMCHFLLRAWKYKEMKIPPSFPLLVRSVNPQSGAVGGIIPNFLAGATFDIPEWVTAEEIKLGDEFEVAFEDINVYTRKIVVKALRRLGQSGVE